MSTSVGMVWFVFPSFVHHYYSLLFLPPPLLPLLLVVYSLANTTFFLTPNQERKKNQNRALNELLFSFSIIILILSFSLYANLIYKIQCSMKIVCTPLVECKHTITIVTNNLRSFGVRLRKIAQCKSSLQ